MRVVHISTYDIDGGAARAAFRVHESLLAAGLESAMLVRTRHSKAETVHQLPAAKESDVVFGDLIQQHCVDQNRTSLSTTWFSIGWPGADLASHPLVLKADIIHLHWVAGLVSPSSLAPLQALGKPIVWTLHDQRTFTGGCHYTSGCNQFETDCAVCPQLREDPYRLTAANVADQIRTLAASPITVIAPSRWMAECARRSAVLATSRIEVIPYGIDIDRFQALPQAEARAQLGLGTDDFLLLFGVDNAREKRKGLRELFAALEACAKDEVFQRAAGEQKMSLLCFGELGAVPDLPIPVKAFGRVHSDEVLGLLYAAADLFLLPSLEDNLPNTVMESMCCGTPVGAFAVGGVPDLIVEGQTGFMARVGDVEGLTQIVVNSARDLQGLRSMRAACRQRIEANFTYAHQAQNCLALYDDLLRNNQHSTSQVPALQPAEAGAHFQRAFAPLLKSILEANPHALLPSEAGASGREKLRHAQVTQKMLRILRDAVREPRPYTYIRAALDSERAVLANATTWGAGAKLFLRRLWAGS